MHEPQALQRLVPGRGTVMPVGGGADPGAGLGGSRGTGDSHRAPLRLLHEAQALQRLVSGWRAVAAGRRAASTGGRAVSAGGRAVMPAGGGADPGAGLGGSRGTGDSHRSPLRLLHEAQALQRLVSGRRAGGRSLRGLGTALGVQVRVSFLLASSWRVPRSRRWAFRCRRAAISRASFSAMSSTWVAELSFEPSVALSPARASSLGLWSTRVPVPSAEHEMSW